MIRVLALLLFSTSVFADERAFEAMGGRAAVEAAASAEVVFEGTYSAREQARRPADVMQSVGRRMRIVLDFHGKRALREAEQLFPGGIRFSFRAVTLPKEAWSIDLLKWRQGTDIQRLNEEQSASTRASYERMLPHWALLQNAADVTPSFHPSGLLAGTKVGTLEVRYDDYKRRGKLLVPRRVRIYNDGTLVEDLVVKKFVARKLRDEELALPAGYSDAPPAGAPTATRVGDGIWMLENLPNGYRSMFAERDDHVIVFEAPQQAAYAKAQLEQIRNITKKPVRYVVVTHHHGDHTGALAAYAAEGATLLVPRGASVAIRRQFERRKEPLPAKIEEVLHYRSLGPGIELHDIPNAHVEGDLAAYFRDGRYLFQGDLFYIPERGPVPKAFPVSRDLAKAIRRLGLDVDTVAGVHGRPGTWREFRGSLGVTRRSSE